MCAYGPNILGYCDEDVDAAAIEQIKKGNCVTSPDKIMIECAELLVDTVATADWAFFAKNGNDATQGAILTARAHTRRKSLFSSITSTTAFLQWCRRLTIPVLHLRMLQITFMPVGMTLKALKRLLQKTKMKLPLIIAQPYNHGNFIDNAFPVDGF